MAVLKKTNKQERLFATIHPDFAAKVGAIGVLAGRYNRNGERKIKKWHYFNAELNTPEFMSDFQKCVFPYFSDDNLLSSIDDMQIICEKYYNNVFKYYNNADYIFRIDSDIYSYFIRCIPYRGIFYIYAYLTDPVEKHIEKAKIGITFVNIKGESMFTVPDGEQIMIIYDKDTKQPRTVRYIDDKTFQVGSYIYTPYEFADCMDDIEAEITPLRSTLPVFCFYYHRSSGRMQLIKKGDKRSISTTEKFKTEEGIEKEKYLNQKLHITEQQQKAMLAGIQYGWDSPEADPDYYAKGDDADV